MNSRWILLPTALVASTSGYATTYLNVEEAQASIFPGVKFSPAKVTLTDAQKQAVEKASGVRVRSVQVRAWADPAGNWFVIDDVLGKHEFITMALGIDAHGAVHGVEIMDYRETYGDGVRGAAWRSQFIGKTTAAPLKLDQDIRNIGGGTLSSRHVTDGVKRLLATHEVLFGKS